MTEYVTGFLFADDFSEVALIRKIKPQWQAGKYNGIGGHVEPGETLIEAMCREFREETGLDLPPNVWQYFVTIKGPDYAVHFYRGFLSTGTVNSVRTTTEEHVDVFLVRELLDPWDMSCLSNLKWLIPMALSMDYDRAESFVVTEVMAA